MSAWVAITSAEVSLLPGFTYAAKLQLTGLESTFGNAGAVKGKLEGAGFGSVHVWAHAAPADFPDSSVFPDGDTYFATGVWNGKRVSKAMPSEVKLVWQQMKDAAPADLPPLAADAALPKTPAPEVLQMPTVNITASPADDDWSLIAILAAVLFLTSRA